MAECYIRGNTIKYLRIQPEVIDMVHEEDLNKKGNVYHSHMITFNCLNLKKSCVSLL